jgi:MoaA/NifB/PqqE/SkfB family radical SAM enzyme
MSVLAPTVESRTGDELHSGIDNEQKIEAGRLFAHFDKLNLPQPFEIEYLENAAKRFASLNDFLTLVPSRPLLQNFATSIWEFANGVDTLKSYPWNISIPVADLCNARCTFCTSWLDGRKVLDLDQLELFEPVLRRAMFIGLVGHGEPLAHPRFDELCERLQPMLDPLSTCYTITNGALLDKWRDLLRRINLCSYSVSLNAATAETHDEVMGLGRDAFPRIIESIADLTKPTNQPGRLNNNVYITMVVTKQNIAEIPAFIALGNSLGVTGIWLRSLLPQSNLISGLNYHLLPPSEHPEFERLRRAAVDAITASRVPVQADPAMWDKPIFSTTLEREIREKPPAIIPREQALRDRDLRRRNMYLYEQPKGTFRGQPVAGGTVSEVKWSNGRLHVVTPKSDGAYAASVNVTYPADTNSHRLTVKVDADCRSGALGLALLDVEKNSWLTRVHLPAGARRTVSLETLSVGQPVKLVILNGGSDLTAASGSIGEVRIQVEGIGQSLPIDWTTLVVHNSADTLDDGTNPLGRVPRFACKAVYYNLYINELFYRMNPCCYLQRVPGYEEIRFDGSIDFMEAWNSPGMVALREHLRDGPLFGACVRCPEKW